MIPVVALVAVLVSGAAPSGPSIPEVQQKLMEIESAIVRGNVDPIRLQLQAQARERPGDVQLRVYLAWCGMPSDDSWNALKGVVQIYPDQPWAHLGMGRIYEKWKMGDQAAGEYQAALKANPGFYPALVGLGDLARGQGKPDEAVAQYRKALALHDDPRAHAGLGLALVAQGQAGAAKPELAMAVTEWPDQPEVLKELVRLARAEKDLKTAADWAEKLAMLQPRDGAVQRLLADLRYDSGDKAAAAKEYEKAARLGVVDVTLQRRLAEIYRQLGNVDGEQHAVEQLAVLEKSLADHPLRLSELAEQKGDLEAAEAQMLEAIQRAPTRADLHARLARLRMKQEQFRDALDAYRAALAAPENKVDGLEKEAAELAKKFELPRSPAKGSIDQIYARVSAQLTSLFLKRSKEKPGLGGTIKIRVHVDEHGKVESADVIDESVGDPWLVGNAYFALKDAVFPKQKRDPVFEFDLRPVKGRK